MNTTQTGSAGFNPLTGLRNRSHLDILETSFASRRAPWSLIILDVDHFKLINDIHGHLGEAWKQLEKLSGYQHPPSTESEILLVQGMLMMNEPDAGPAAMKGAAGFIRESIGGLEQGHSAPEAALRYATLARTLTLG